MPRYPKVCSVHCHALRCWRCLVGIAVTLMLVPLARLRAQPTPASSRDTSRTNGVANRALMRLPPRNSYSLWAGGALAMLTAYDNRSVHGSMRMIAAQRTRDLFTWRSARVEWVTEVIPLMLVTSGAPPERFPVQLTHGETSIDSSEPGAYQSHTSWGFGASPLSAQAAFAHGDRLTSVVQVTSGAVWFSKLVPFGRATQFNFVVAPSASMQWRVSGQTQVAVGYAFHHLSNGNFGTTNPGLNSPVLFTRVTRTRELRTP